MMAALRPRLLLVAALLYPVVGGDPAAGAASYITPSATLEPNPIGLGQTTVLTISVETSGLSDVQFEPRFKLE
ncbi:hypothetical protein, partial [Litorivivens sp.]|uniref:hypothetical protein n=1 Tax=Litorivivens sp. TaxID=2020868 RepID=UPI003562062B